MNPVRKITTQTQCHLKPRGCRRGPAQGDWGRVKLTINLLFTMKLDVTFRKFFNTHFSVNQGWVRAAVKLG